MADLWKWYVYQFFRADDCMYVGKGSGKRFKAQQSRFKQYAGQVIAYFKTEADALAHEYALIQELAPPHNVAGMPASAEPWRKLLLPESDRDFYAWCDVLGTRQMAARVLLSYGRAIEKYGVDLSRIWSKVDRFDGARA